MNEEMSRCYHFLLKMGGIGILQCHVSVQRCFGEFGDPLRPCPPPKNKLFGVDGGTKKTRDFHGYQKNRQFRKQSNARIGLETCLRVTHFSPTVFREGTGFREPVPVTGLAVPGNQFRESGPGFDGFRQALRFQGSGFSFPVARNRIPDPGIVKVPVQKVACPRFRKFRCSMGSDGLGSVPEVWTEQVLGTGFREPEVLKRFRVPEIPFPRFRKLLCTLKVHFCTLNLNSCKLKVYSCTFKVYFCTSKVYFCTLKVYFCTLPQCLLQAALKIQYSKGKEKVVISVHFINANLLVGDTTYAYFFLRTKNPA